VIVTGCLGAEADVITERHPGVLAVTGPHQYEQVMTAVHTHLPAPDHPFVSLVPESGVRLTPRHYAYLKISEGCNNRCSFCIIPSLRGDLASRRIDAVLREAEQLTKAGVKEILVISQDTSAYGLDVKYAPYKWRDKERQTRFRDLCEGLGELQRESGVWVRLHYVYPYPHVDDVMPMMADGQILPYLDIPFQHSSPAVLKQMRRPANIDRTAERIAKWRSEVPDLVLRSSFIVGFPGETDEDFEHLLGWMKETRIERAGCFKYENVTGATSAALPGHVPEEVKEERWHRFMQAQSEIADGRAQAMVGQTIDVIIDEIDEDGAVGRSKADAPEIDGSVFMADAAGLKQGDVVRAKVHAGEQVDLWAEVVS
jgi:ribosomal protein S12 methylthiotransferase